MYFVRRLCTVVNVHYGQMTQVSYYLSIAGLSYCHGAAPVSENFEACQI